MTDYGTELLKRQFIGECRVQSLCAVLPLNGIA